MMREKQRSILLAKPILHIINDPSLLHKQNFLHQFERFNIEHKRQSPNSSKNIRAD